MPSTRSLYYEHMLRVIPSRSFSFTSEICSNPLLTLHSIMSLTGSLLPYESTTPWLFCYVYQLASFSYLFIMYVTVLGHRFFLRRVHTIFSFTFLTSTVYNTQYLYLFIPYRGFLLTGFLSYLHIVCPNLRLAYDFSDFFIPSCSFYYVIDVHAIRWIDG